MEISLENLEKSLFNYAVGQFVAKRHHVVTWQDVPLLVRTEAQAARDSLFTTKPQGLLIMGPVGSGKTSVISLIVIDYIRRVIKAVAAESWKDWQELSIDPDFKILEYAYRHLRLRITLVTHTELVQKLRAHFEPEDRGRVVRGLPYDLEKPIVLIDDLGIAHDDRSRWNLSLQQDYFDWRWRENLPTFITTNRAAKRESPDYIRKWPGWERIVDRICDPEFMTTVVLNRESRRRA